MYSVNVGEILKTVKKECKDRVLKNLKTGNIIEDVYKKCELRIRFP